MGKGQSRQYTRDRQLLLAVYFLFYFAVFLFFAGDHRLLSQVRPVVFNFNRDLTELALIGTGLPRFMIAHPLCFTVADTLAFLLPAALLGYALREGRFSLWLGGLFTLFLALYLLLADLFWQVHHEPFILYLLLSFAFLTNREDRFYRILQGCRYYFLYLFVSAAVWKIARGAVFHGEEMSRILLVQHSDLLSGDCTGWSCRFYAWLIDHPFPAQLLYLGGVALEAAFLIGFFTRRYDRLLLSLAVLFVVADLLLMRIPYWTILLGGITLRPASRPRQRVMVIYETTHHENLPGLLDLCETRFSRVVVFLKDISYNHISGGGSPASRWPRTEFIVQTSGHPNRVFISGVFAYLRRHRCSHFHLSTLDNNLLLFAWRLCLANSLQVSLTVHEVNEYFAYSFGSPRDWTESLAKFLLHHRIKHYTFFLPAMADQFSRRMPDATTVFIPSRFYSSPTPGAEEKSPPGAEEKRAFSIVIPGSVDPNRRDYDFVVDFFRSWPATPSGQVRLVILGDSDSPFGAGILAQLRLLESAHFRVESFAGYIPETIYEQELVAADLLWSPLRVHKKSSRNSPETYGLTTASGLTADLLLNNVPALVPAAFVLSEPFRTALLPYGSPQEAGLLLDRLIGDPTCLRDLRQAIHSAFSSFTKENFRVAFAALAALPQEE
jgi:hypothetical protein